MKMHDVKYLVGEGCRNTWQNRLMALASVGVLICCLLLTGLAYMVFVNMDSMTKNAYNQNVVTVYAEKECDATQVAAIGQQLEAMDNIAKVEFLSKEDFLAMEFDGVLEDVTLDSFSGAENPLPDTFIVSMVDLTAFDTTLAAMEAIDGVEEIDYDGDLAKTLTKVRRVVLGVCGSVIVVLLAVSLFIIVNTIKLTVFNRRLEIYIMKSVGATDSFVRFPFVVEGMLLGLTAGAVGYGLLYGLYTVMIGGFDLNNAVISLVPFAEQWLPLLLGFILGGVAVGISGSVISMGKYLKQEGSERIR